MTEERTQKPPQDAPVKTARALLTRKLGAHLANELVRRARPRTVLTFPALACLAAADYAIYESERLGSRYQGPNADINDIRAGLGLIGTARDDVRHIEYNLINHARDAHVTWDEVAKLLGLKSRQAAQERWTRLDMWVKTDGETPLE